MQKYKANVTNITGCTFSGPVWDKEKMVALISVAKGLEHLAAVFNHQGMNAPFINIIEEAPGKEEKKAASEKRKRK